MIGILGAVAGITDCIAGLEMSVACSGMRAGLEWVWMKRYEKIHTVLYMGTGYLSSNLGVYSAVLYNF